MSAPAVNPGCPVCEAEPSGFARVRVGTRVSLAVNCPSCGYLLVPPEVLEPLAMAPSAVRAALAARLAGAPARTAANAVELRPADFDLPV